MSGSARLPARTRYDRPRRGEDPGHSPDDAEELARLQVDVWADAYADLMPVTVFEERRATIPVGRANDRAITFYRKHGFAEDGVTRSDDHGIELRMVRRAGTS